MKQAVAAVPAVMRSSCHAPLLMCEMLLVSISLLHWQTSDWMLRWCRIRSGCGRQTHNVSDIRRQSCMTRFQHSKFIVWLLYLLNNMGGCYGRMTNKADLSARQVAMTRCVYISSLLSNLSSKFFCCIRSVCADSIAKTNHGGDSPCSA